jgi:hypothetical protein
MAHRLQIRRFVEHFRKQIPDLDAVQSTLGAISRCLVARTAAAGALDQPDNFKRACVDLRGLAKRKPRRNGALHAATPNGGTPATSSRSGPFPIEAHSLLKQRHVRISKI